MPFLEAAAAQAAGQTVEPAVKCGTWICKVLKRRYNRVKNLDSNFLKLTREEKYLCNREADIQTRLDGNDGKMITTEECKTWLSEVHTMKGDINSLRQKYDSTNKWLCGLCPFSSLHRLGKNVVYKTQEVIILKDRMKLDSIIMIPAPRAPLVTATRKRHPLKLDDVPSLKEHVEKLINYLKDNEVKSVGVYGIPGVGKTTVLENLYNHVHGTQLFDIVLLVSIQKGDSIRKIQQKLVQELKLKVKGINDTDQIALMVSTALEGKKYLLLLDDVTSDLNLKRVGVHIGNDHGKVVLACQERIHTTMPDELIEIKRMSDMDALELFKSVVGDVICCRHIKPVARKLVKECAGIPSVIKLIAQYLKNKSEDVWRDTLFRLQSPSIGPVEQLSDVEKPFKFIYEKLQPKEKECLQYVAIFPADYEIYQDYLIECWRAEKLISSEQKLEHTRINGCVMLDTFTNKCLLEKGRKMWCYKLPMFFQRIALKVAYLNKGSSEFLVAEVENIQENTNNQWDHVRRVSLIYQQLCDLPERPNCCTISTLLLQRNRSLTTIPEAFFGYMCGLRVLDLCGTNITSLPPSIFSLMCIKALYLNKCTQLQELPTRIGELESLEILDIRGTGIHSLPIELGQLGNNLRCLRVSFKQDYSTHNHVDNQPGAIIPSNLISKLSLLEELSIEVNLNNKRWKQISDAVTEEVASLEALTSLAFFFPNTRCLENFVVKSKSWNKENFQQGGETFRSFDVIVGSHEWDNCDHLDIHGYSTKRYIRFSAGENILDTVSKILYQATSFDLVGHQFIKSLSDFGADILDGLKACGIQECQEMNFLIYGNMVEDHWLPFLEELHLVNLPTLSYILHGQINSGSLSKLTTLTLKHCPSIKKLFPRSQQSLGLFNQLKYLTLDGCSSIVELIENGDALDPEFLPKLKEITLHDLSNLSAICNVDTMLWPSLETLVINGCPELKQLPFNLHNATKLKLIRCTENWKNQLTWPDDNIKDRLNNIFC